MVFFVGSQPSNPFWGFACRFRHCQFQPDFAIAEWFDTSRPLLGTNARQGEATNPGPSESSVSSFVDIRCGITNPTCLANKSDKFRSLVRSHDLHLVSMSETAATTTQQKHLF